MLDQGTDPVETKAYFSRAFSFYFSLIWFGTKLHTTLSQCHRGSGSIAGGRKQQEPLKSPLWWGQAFRRPALKGRPTCRSEVSASEMPHRAELVRNFCFNCFSPQKKFTLQTFGRNRAMTRNFLFLMFCK